MPKRFFSSSKAVAHFEIDYANTSLHGSKHGSSQAKQLVLLENPNGVNRTLQ
jgi:hypothetical protein